MSTHEAMVVQAMLAKWILDNGIFEKATRHSGIHGSMFFQGDHVAGMIDPDICVDKGR